MSNIAISGHASGTGVFTIASPNSNTDRTLTLPNSAGTLATAESTLAQFNASGTAPVYAARAWVNFNGTGTVAIRASGNVSSITDNGVGDYTVNFATAMSDANYNASAGGSVSSGAVARFFGFFPVSATTTKITYQNLAGNSEDPLVVAITIFR